MADMDGDGVLDGASGELRMQLHAAMQAAQSVIRMRAQRAEAEAKRDVERARELQRQLDAEKAVARAELAPVGAASWWDQAQPGDVARVYEQAVAWRDVDPAARAAEERIRNELRDRYDIDVLETSADPTVVRAALERSEDLREQSAAERREAERDRDDALGYMTEADLLTLEADSSEASEAQRLRTEADLAEVDANLAWDSSERRDAHATALSQAGHAEAAAAWKQADVDQARNPREAVAAGKRKSPKARAAAAAQPTRQNERAGR